MKIKLEINNKLPNLSLQVHETLGRSRKTNQQAMIQFGSILWSVAQQRAVRFLFEMQPFNQVMSLHMNLNCSPFQIKASKTKAMGNFATMFRNRFWLATLDTSVNKKIGPLHLQ